MNAKANLLHAGPAVGFDTPFEMLSACHERVQRSLRLLQRLQAHVVAQGVDRQAREAAADVLRYFDIAGPAHHEDEERHVLPRLRASGLPALVALAERLHAEHGEMTRQWAALRPALHDLAEGRPVALSAEACAGFAHLYAGHIEAEEALAYPAARARTAPHELPVLGAEMAARRRAPAAGPEGATAPR